MGMSGSLMPYVGLRLTVDLDSFIPGAHLYAPFQAKLHDLADMRDLVQLNTLTNDSSYLPG
jgi:hypothetical protein